LLISRVCKQVLPWCEIKANGEQWYLMMHTLFTQNVLTITSFYDRRFKALLRAYVYFLNHMQLNEKKFKKFMRSHENLPNLLKNILGFEDCKGFFFILSEYHRSHICGQCCKTSHKKCSACRVASSCSMECHTKHWAEGKELCNKEESGRKLFEKQRRTILDLLVTQFSTSTTLVSYDVFQQELFDAVFIVSCPLMKDSNDLDIMIGPWFDDAPKSKWTEEMLSLKKKQYAKMYRNLSCGKVQMQWKAAWGWIIIEHFCEWLCIILDVNILETFRIYCELLYVYLISLHSFKD